MNDDRRKKVQEALSKLDDCKSIIEDVRDGEQESFDNMPENMAAGEKGQKIEANVEYLDEAVNSVGEAIDQLGNIE